MLETILIAACIYLTIGAFCAGLVAEGGYIRFLILFLMMILWPFFLIATIGFFVKSAVSRRFK